MMDSQKFCLKWDGFQSSVTSVFDHLRQDGELVDITLCCEGHQVRAHKMMLSACSPYFRDLLKNNPCQQMVFFLKDTSAADLSAIIEFMYKGSVNVAQTQLASFIKTAEMLQIRGLSGDDDKPPPSPEERRPPVSRPGGLRSPRPPPPPPPAAKRRRTSDGGPESAAIVGRVSPPPPPPQQQHQQPAASPSHYAEFPARSDPAPGGSPPPANHALPPLPAAGGGGGGPPPQSPAGQPSESIKVEKVDLTEEDDDGSLDATLGYVAEYEGAGYGEEPPDLSAMAEAVAAMPGGAVAGPSQRASADDSSATGAVFCKTCGQAFYTRRSLINHHCTSDAHEHEQHASCQLCGVTHCSLPYLRSHLERKHHLSPAEVLRLVPTRVQSRQVPAATQEHSQRAALPQRSPHGYGSEHGGQGEALTEAEAHQQVQTAFQKWWILGFREHLGCLSQEARRGIPLLREQTVGVPQATNAEDHALAHTREFGGRMQDRALWPGHAVVRREAGLSRLQWRQTSTSAHPNNSDAGQPR